MPLTKASGYTAVRLFQERLNLYMHPSPGLTPDGDFGPKTLAAVQAWERNTNVPVAFRTVGYIVSDYTLGTLGIAAPAGASSFPAQMAYSGKVLFVHIGNGNYRRVRDGATVSYAQAQAQQFDEHRRVVGSTLPVAGSTGTPAQSRGDGGYFTWAAPAKSGWVMESWQTAIARFKNLLAARGFSSVQADWKFSGVGWTFSPITLALPVPGYALTASGMAPAGANSSMVADIAEQAGFQIDRSAMDGNFTGTPGGGDDDPRGKTNWLAYAVVALVVVVVVREL